MISQRHDSSTKIVIPESRQPTYLGGGFMQASAAVLLDSQPLTSVKTSKRLKLKRIGIRHWQRLMSLGVPQKEAKQLAIAVVRYSHLDCRPSFQEKRLIGRYCQHLCAAGLWRLELLLGS